MHKVPSEAVYVGDLTHKSEDSTLFTIDRQARVCYRSESVVPPIRFVSSLWKRGHWSTLESSQLVIKVDEPDDFLRQLLPSGKYRFFDLDLLKEGWVGGSLRTWIETYQTSSVNRPDVFGKIKYMMPRLLAEWDIDPVQSDPVTVPDQLRRHSAYMVVDRGIMAEITRHDMSFLVESTRYVDLSGRMEFIDPLYHIVDSSEPGTLEAYRVWERACQQSETNYAEMRELVRPELARQVLPMSLATRMYITALPSYWSHFFTLRRSPKAHPLVREACELLYPQMAHIF